MKKDLASLTQREYQLKLSLNDDDIKTRLEIVRLEMEALAKTYGMKIRQSGSVQKKDGSKMSDEERQIAQRIANINALEIKAAKKANKEAQDRKTKKHQTDKSKPLTMPRNYQEQRQPLVLRQWRTVWKRRLPYLSRSVRKR